ncbi:3'-5' exoribonuclease [Paraburkholderia bryophila]|uniref:Uncharacterized protein n=1 Tax=Paraburkholderia bryophila TaxID=420952 RepID=A0A7Y9WCR9_9BURK|nr:3'-5' exoribonuclease [Paraburkholderia bryophila]NYH17848.1 hypothetical protein [Paraburkholderia bryophila]
MRYFLDTEFTAFDACQLISVAIVSQDGNEFYGECSDFERPLCSDFVRETVLPQLGQFAGRSMPSAQLRSELQAWLEAVPVAAEPVLSFDFSGDFELVCHLLGASLPHGWKAENIETQLDTTRRAAYFDQHGGEHHALHDARANRYAMEDEHARSTIAGVAALKGIIRKPEQAVSTDDMREAVAQHIKGEWMGGLPGFMDEASRDQLLPDDLLPEARVQLQSVPVKVREGLSSYVRLTDIPQPWRDRFRTALRGSGCPAIDGEGECAYEGDWSDWLQRAFPRG